MRKEKLIIILLALAMCTIVGKETYAYYISNMKVNIISTSSEVICDAEITEVPNAEKTKLGYSEFKVIVKNHDSSNNITKEPFNYTLNIENNGTTNGVFGYNDTFNQNLEITGQMSNNTSTETGYIIKVKANSGLQETVNYKVKLSCVQTN